MNIWLLQASEPMPVVNSGERLLRMGMIAKELDRRKHKIIWFANTFDHFQKEQLYNEDTIINVNENYSLYLIHGNGYKKNISISRIMNHKKIAKKFSEIAKTLEKPDLIYVSFPTIDYAEAAVKYGKENNVPVIVDIRDLWPDIFYHNLQKVLSIIATPYIKWMNCKTKRIMRDAYAINAVSGEMVNWGLAKGKRQKQETDRYFYIGYEKQKESVLQEQDLINKEKFNISFFATINNQFDYDRIIKLAEEIEKKDKDIMINICGDGPQLTELKAKIEKLSNVCTLGWLGKEKLNYVLKNSELGLAPYKNTFDFQMSVSNKFAEYISYGLPIILTSEGYMKKLLEKYECGFSTQDMTAMCEWIIALKNNPEEYQRMSSNAMNLYEKEFIAEKIYEELVDYLEKIKEEQKI